MKHKVSELSGALLDAAVAKAEGYASADAVPLELRGEHWDEAMDTGGYFDWRPSELWHQAGPIIDRERIDLESPDGFHGGHWGAIAWGSAEQAPGQHGGFTGTGRTAMIAAMRAYVASKFGEEVELP